VTLTLLKAKSPGGKFPWGKKGSGKLLERGFDILMK